MRGKAVGILLGTIVLLGGGLAMASSDKKKKLPKSSKEEDNNEEIEVTIPTQEGGEQTVVMDEDTAIKEGESTAPPTKIDERLEVIASSEDKSIDDSVTEVVKTVTDNQAAPPLAIEEISPQFDPDGTVSLGRLLLVREELPGWQSDTLDGDIGRWQMVKGLDVDDKFGPYSCAKMAEEVGILPLCRYWPKSVTTKAQAKELYKSLITKVIDDLKKNLPDSQAHIDALTASINREKAVTFGNSNPPIQQTRQFVLDINDAIAEAGELKGEKELKK